MTFFEEIIKLKYILRKGWLICGVGEQDNKSVRIESDAEHTYSMALLALEIMNKKHLNLDQAKVLKMIVYHELCEIDYGDHVPMEQIPKEVKYQNEKKAISRITTEHQMPEIVELWEEFEANKTPEAVFVKKIDKLDALLQSKYYSELLNKPEIYESFIVNNRAVYDEFIDEFGNYI